MKLEDKVAVVAGGGPGIGEGVVKVLAEEGADVAIIDISEAQAKRIADDVKKLGRKSVGIAADLTDKQQCEKAVQTSLDALGKIDGLVNIVGGIGSIFLSKDNYDFVKQTPEEWDQIFKLNLMTAVFMCQAIAPYFMKQRYGKIVNTASTCAKSPGEREMAYCCSKAAVLHFSRSLALILAPYDINVNILCPGDVFTPGFEQKTKAQRLRIEADKYKGLTAKELFDKVVMAGIPLKRAQEPEDMGHAVAFLLSDESKNMSGQPMYVDGGQYL